MSSHNNDSVKPNQATETTSPHTEASPGSASLNSGRRKITGLGVGAPLILTLASRSVLATNAQCLSNQLSGNLSHPRGYICHLGWSPGGWGQPGGNIGSRSTANAWSAIGYTYGNLKQGGQANKFDDYIGGTTMSQIPSWLIKDSVLGTKRVAEVLVNNSAYNTTRHLIAAYFNALLSELTGSTFKYVLTTTQVQQLANGTITPPGGKSISEFLDTTWNP